MRFSQAVCGHLQLFDRAPKASRSGLLEIGAAERVEAKLAARDAFQLALKCTAAHRANGFILKDKDLGASALTREERQVAQMPWQDRQTDLLKQLDWQIDTGSASAGDWAMLLKEHVEIDPKPSATGSDSAQEIMRFAGVDSSLDKLIRRQLTSNELALLEVPPSVKAG